MLDDTKGGIQAQLKSDHQHSQLSLGNITRIEDTAGRKDARGEGWELRTDGHGVARAAKGMLITTEARPGATSHIKDMGETVHRLNAAHDQHKALAELAQQYDAHGQTEIAAAIKTQNQAIKGTVSTGGRIEELAAPHLVLASPAGIETTTSGSTHLASGKHMALTTGENLSIASGDSLFASIRQAFRLFVHKAGMRLIAAAGDIDLRALSNSINLLAKLDITQTANRITITAKEEVLINGGGSYARFSAAGIEHGTNGTYVAHAMTYSWSGPKNISMAIAMPPQSKIEERGVFHLGSHAAANGRANANIPFKLYKDDNLVEEGKIDNDGNLIFKHDMDSQAKYKIELPNGQRYIIDPDAQTDAHEVSAGLGYHGYRNAGGSLSEAHSSLEQDRLLANPAMPNDEPLRS